MLREGDWILDWTNHFGYIEKITKGSTWGTVVQSYYIFFPHLNKTERRGFDEISYYPEEPVFDEFLVDLALQTKDFEWLKELKKEWHCR